MKAIKITQENAEKLEAALAEVNGRATQHCYTTAEELLVLASKAEKYVGKLLLKKDFSGAVWHETSGEAVANSYKSMRKATCVCIERRSSDWFLTDVKSTTIGTNGGGSGYVSLTEAQDKAAKEKLSKLYVVRKGEES
jgi:3-hydroxy-3-methylglutaryl CoA synthase